MWVNPKIWHGIGVVESGATHNRISVVAWPTGTLEYPGADLKTNTLV